MHCADQALAAAMPQMVLDIDYANFKDAASTQLGSARAHRYHQVWDVLYGMPEDAPEPEANDEDPLPWPSQPPRGIWR